LLAYVIQVLQSLVVLTFAPLYAAVIRAVEWIADAVQPLQFGDVNLYLFYVFLVILLAYLLGAL
jgi:hypothetical protein